MDETMDSVTTTVEYSPLPKEIKETKESIEEVALQAVLKQKLVKGERVEMNHITDRCFRVNVWVDEGEGIVANCRIIRSYFVIVRSPDDVEIK